MVHLESNGTTFFGPLYNEQKQLDAGEDPYAPRPRENEHYTNFRKRMGTDEAKETYKLRAAAAEFPNAACRNQGLNQFSVRGLIRAKAQLLLHAIAHNFRRFLNLKDSTGRTYLEIVMTG